MSLVKSIDLEEMDRLTLNASLAGDAEIEQQIGNFAELAELASGPIPELLLDLSVPINYTWETYKTKSEFNAIKMLLNVILKLPARQTANLIKAVARFFFYFADAPSYQSLSKHPTPDLKLWADCNLDNHKFGQAYDYLKRLSSIEDKRKELLAIYAALRPVYCALDGRKNEPIGSDVGDIIYRYLQTTALDTTTPEKDFEETLTDLQENFKSVIESEEQLADWLAVDPNKSQAVSALLFASLEGIQNKTLFSNLKENIERLAGFITGRNPQTDRFLVLDLIDAAALDMRKLTRLEDYLGFDADDIKVLQLVDDILSHSESDSQGLVQTIEQIGGGSFTAGRDKLVDTLFDGGTVSGNYRLVSFPDMCFKKPDGSRLSLASSRWTRSCECIKHYEDNGYSQHRAMELCIQDCLHKDYLGNYLEHCGDSVGENYNDFALCARSDAVTDELWNVNCYSGVSTNSVSVNVNEGILKPGNDDLSLNKEEIQFRTENIAGLDVPSSYEGETFGESLSTNMKILMFNEFSSENSGIATSKREALDTFGDERRNATTIIDQVKYSGLWLTERDRYGVNPVYHGIDTEEVKPYNEVSLLSSLAYMIGGGAAENIYGKYNTIRLADFLSGTFKYTGQIYADVELGVVNSKDPLFTLRVACTYDDCTAINDKIGDGAPLMLRVFRGSRNGGLVRVSPNLGMSAAELLTPGKFVRRNLTESSYRDKEHKHNSWYGRLTPYQGDVENSNFGAGAVGASLAAMNLWQGYGPFTVKGRAPNGTKLKYQNSYYTDRYAAYYMEGNHGDMDHQDEEDFSSLTDYQIAMGTNAGLSFANVSGSGKKITNRSNGNHYSAISGYNPISQPGHTPEGISGNLHIYERIYRPTKAGQPCWSTATDGGKYSYARYGFLRKSNDEGYADDNNCTEWEVIQVDFDSVNDAIQSNTHWLLYDKKIVAVVPVGLAEDDADMAFAYEAAFAAVAFAVVRANGVMGLVNFRVPYSGKMVPGFTEKGHDAIKPRFGNGFWNFYTTRCTQEKYNHWDLIEEGLIEFPAGSYTYNTAYNDYVGLHDHNTFIPSEVNDTGITKSNEGGTDTRCQPCNPNELTGTYKGHPVYKKCPLNSRHQNLQAPAGQKWEIDFTNEGYSGSGKNDRGRAKNSATFVVEDDAERATLTNRFKKTSFVRADSNLLVLLTARGYRKTEDLFPENWLGANGIIADVTKGTILERLLGLIPTTESRFGWKHAVPAIRNLASQYEPGDFLYPGHDLKRKRVKDPEAYTSSENSWKSLKSFSKFENFFKAFFPLNNGEGTLWEKYQRSVDNPGCLDDGIRVAHCLTASEMPHIPRVNGAFYPASYNSQGEVTAWQKHIHYSEFRFASLFTLAAAATGTQYDRLRKYVNTTGNKCSFSDSIYASNPSNCSILTKGQRSDNYTVMGYLRDEYKSLSELKDEWEKISPLALLSPGKRAPATRIQSDGAKFEELENGATSTSYYTNQAIILDPIFHKGGGSFDQTIIKHKAFDRSININYDDNSLLRSLVEKNGGYERDGFLPWLFRQHFWHIPSLEQDVRDWIADLFKQFEFLRRYESGQLSTVDKLRYFFTGEVTGTDKPFKTNGLQTLGNEPVAYLKELAAYIRKLGEDKTAIKVISEAIEGMRLLSVIDKKPFDDSIKDNLPKLARVFSSKDQNNNYIIDKVLNLIEDENVLNPEFFTEISLVKIQSFLNRLAPLFDELDMAVIDAFGENSSLYRTLFYGSLIDEPYYDQNFNGHYDQGEPYFDYNENGTHDGSGMTFGRMLDRSLTDRTDIGGQYTVKTRIPNVFDLSSLVLASSNDEQQESTPLTSTELSDAIGKINGGIDIVGEIDSAIDSAVSDFYNTQVDETYTDTDKNGIISPWEIDDINGNQTADGVTMREYLVNLADSIEQLKNEEANDGDIAAALKLLEEAFDPECRDYSTTRCYPSNRDTVVPDLMNFRHELIDTGLQTDTVLNIKDLLANVLYNSETSEYHYPITALMKFKKRMMELETGDIRLNNETSADLFAPYSTGRYIVNNIKLGSQYDYYDILTDLNTLVHLKEIHDYRSSESMWFRVSEHLHEFTGLAYEQYRSDQPLNINLFSQ